MSVLNNIKIPHNTSYELEDKIAAMEAIMSVDADTADKLKQLLTASNGAELLANNWWIISKKLKK